MTAMTATTDAEIIAATTRWLERAVIGLNLCPFAKAPHVAGRIRSVVSHATSAEGVLEDLAHEAQHLLNTAPDEVETTLLIAPDVEDLANFLSFNDLLGDAEALLEELDFEGELQIASFHPQYQFAGTRKLDVTNYTNRAPYPTLHLLRELSVSNAVDASPKDIAEVIVERNLATMRKLGLGGWRTLFAEEVTAPAAAPK